MGISNVTPMWPVHDIDAARDFLTACLGFNETFRVDGHSHCQAGEGAIRIINAAPGADLDEEARQMHFYVDCDDVDGLYAVHKTELEALPRTHFKPPFDTNWNTREMHIIYLQAQFSVGQPLRSAL